MKESFTGNGILVISGFATLGDRTFDFALHINKPINDETYKVLEKAHLKTILLTSYPEIFNNAFIHRVVKSSRPVELLRN